MIGRFTTRCYDSLADFNAQRPSAVHVSHNSFTDAGLRLIWEVMMGTVDDKIVGLAVGNGSQDFSPDNTRLGGDQTAEATLDDGTQIDAGRVVLTATFGEREAVFEWTERGVVTAKGVLLDRSVGDQGRKPLGAVWQLEAALDLLR